MKKKDPFLFYIVILFIIVLCGCATTTVTESRSDGTIIKTVTSKRTSPVFELRKMIESEGVYNRKIEIDYTEYAITGSADISGVLPVPVSPGAWIGFKSWHIKTGREE